MSVHKDDLAYRFGEAWAALNAWETPISLRQQLGRELTQDEIRAAWPILKWLIPDEIARAGWSRRLERQGKKRA